MRLPWPLKLVLPCPGFALIIPSDSLLLLLNVGFVSLPPWNAPLERPPHALFVFDVVADPDTKPACGLASMRLVWSTQSNVFAIHESAKRVVHQ